MFKKDWVRVLVVVCLCIAIGSGCSWFTKKKTPAGGETTLEPTKPGGTELPLEPREPQGAPIAQKFENVLFAYDSFQVSDAEVAKVQKVAEFMKADPDVKLTTEGNCDERGSAEYNMSLGEHRALAVRACLVGLGIDASRIQTKSYGKEKAIDARHCEEAWRQNRRVEFALSK